MNAEAVRLSEGVLTIAMVGSPNSGKSTLFNALTGASARVGNYPGTTVERMEAPLTVDGLRATLVDTPGSYSLAARSPDERVAIDTVLGRSGAPPGVVVAVVDAPRLARSLYLVLQLIELRLPVVVALNLVDEARRDGVEPDAAALSATLGVPVVATVARTGEGLDALRVAIAGVVRAPATGVGPLPHRWAAPLDADVDEVVRVMPPALSATWGGDPERARAVARWLLLSLDDPSALDDDTDLPHAAVAAIRDRATAAGRDLEIEIVGQRYAWIDAHVPGFLRGATTPDRPLTDRIDRVLLHPLSGSVVFLAVMALVFQALFSWAGPAMDGIEALIGLVGSGVSAGVDALAAALPAAAGPIAFLGELLVGGVIGGVGAVLVFLPQIALLFLFIALLEDSGYLARAAHLMDRVLRAAGLPGRAFVPLLSGYACAVPAIMATRTMPRFRDRLLTMMVVPLTSCSARLPVYSLMVALVFPATWAIWPLSVQATALLAMYLLSTVVTVFAAIVLGRLVVPQEAASELIELPPYRWPHWSTVARTTLARSMDFLREAGRVILVATVILWAALHLPRYEPEALLPPEVVATTAPEDLPALAEPLAIERSFAGRFGKLVEPAIAPLGFDWRVGVGLVGAFAAREVFVSTMGIVFGVGEDVDEASGDLQDRLHRARRADGSVLFTPRTGVSLMVFFAFAMQCLSTLAVLKRETRGWRWPAFITAYMTALAWGSAWLVYAVGGWLGFA